MIILEEHDAFILTLLASPAKMETAYFSETLVYDYTVALHNNSGNHTL
jgi:hypothetical protein